LLLYVLMLTQLRGLESRRLFALLVKIAVASVPIVAVCAASTRWLLGDWQHQALLPKIAALLVTVAAGAALFAACGILLHIEELKELRNAFMRRLKRQPS
jgi:peptidoglycan biosynthesis protein MviN/MurJ (putative lipid II flippase)